MRMMQGVPIHEEKNNRAPHDSNYTSRLTLALAKALQGALIAQLGLARLHDERQARVDRLGGLFL